MYVYSAVHCDIKTFSQTELLNHYFKVYLPAKEVLRYEYIHTYLFVIFN